MTATCYSLRWRGVTWCYIGLFSTSESLANYSLGLSSANFQENWHPEVRVEFGNTLGLFFPCFTGMLSGADRADVLRDPARNIRYGTFAALTLSLVVYLSIMFLWAGVANRAFLLGYANDSTVKDAWFARESSPSNPEAAHTVLDRVVTFPHEYVVYIGILLSCFAQVLQCLIVAPRLLQAISKDSILPFLKRFGEISESGEPRKALLLTYCIALALTVTLKIVAIFSTGSTDALVTAAQLVTICFLVCYGFLNATCVTLTFFRSTTWRPEGIFRFRWRMWYITWGMVGLLSSMVIMFEVSHTFSIVIIFASMILYGYINWVGSEAEWGLV